MEKYKHFSVITLVLLVQNFNFVFGQIVGERLHGNYGQIFSSVDSDLDDNLFENFVDFTGGEYLDYEDQMPSESVLTEEQLTARQIKLRELYKGRRRGPVNKDGKNSIKMNFFNNRLKKKTEILAQTEKSRENETAASTSKPNKHLDIHPSGLAVTVVKPPPGFKPSENVDVENKKGGNLSLKSREKSSPLNWDSKQQKQRAALATSIIGSRLKDLKEKRKLLMNTNIVTERSEESKSEKIESRIDKDFESLEEAQKETGSHLLKVHIEEKSSESTSPILFPTKKRRFKPQIKSTAVSQKWSIKDKLKNKNKLEVAGVTIENTKAEHVGDGETKANEKDVIKKKQMIKEAVEDNKESTPEAVSEEILDQVYGKLDGLYDKLEKIKNSSEELEAVEKKPSWMNKKKKKGTPLKKINVEESAVPVSIVPHGVPIKRGFNSGPKKVLVMPSSPPLIKSQPTSVTITQSPTVTQFLQFLPYSSTTSTTTEIVPEERTINEADNDNIIEDAVEDKLGFSAEQILELEEEEIKDADTMTADIINENIEKVLKIQMPQHTKLLYGDTEGSDRYQRNSNSTNTEVGIS